MRDLPHVPAATVLPPPLVLDAQRWADDDGTPADRPSLEVVRLLTRLRSCVASHVAERRAAGATLARVIPELRCLVREAESCEGSRDSSDSLLAQVVRWGVEAYHASDDEPEVPHVARCY